ADQTCRFSPREVRIPTQSRAKDGAAEVRLKRRLFLWLVILAMLQNWPEVRAAETMRIQAEKTTTSGVFVGQRVTVTVKLMTPTVFAGVAVFEFPQVAGVLLMHVDDRPVLGSEQIDDTTFTTQLHELAVFCIKPGKHEIPPFAVRIGSPPKFGAPPEEHRL